MANVIYGSDYSNDTLAGGSGDDIIYGLAGNDVLYGSPTDSYGDESNDSLYGGNGDDTLCGGEGQDTLYGELGNDTYLCEIEKQGETVVDSGGNADTLLLSNYGYASRMADAYVYMFRLSGPNLHIQLGSAGFITVVDQFVTDRSANIEYFKTADGMLSLAMQQGYTGGTGADLIVGWSGASGVIDGGAGDDWLWGSYINDTIFGGDGDDEIRGEGGNDSLSGGSGADVIFGAWGNSTIDGGLGIDTVSYRGGENQLCANLSGVDQVVDGRAIAADTVLEISRSWNPAIGLVYSVSSVDKLISVEIFKDTGDSDYVLLGRTGIQTTVSLGEGYDTVAGGASDSSFQTTVSYSSNIAGAIVNLGGSSLAATLGGQVYSVEKSTARDGWGCTDTFLLDDRGFAIEGSSFGDHIHGRDSLTVRDSIIGGAGNDTIDGGTGVDTVSYDSSSTGATLAGVVVNLSPNTVTPMLTDGTSVILLAGQGRDNWGNIDALSNIENVTGSRLDDYIVGSAGANFFQGGDGNDYIRGQNGDDQLSGGHGNDTLVGGAGYDGFLFDIPLGASGNVDRLTDFDPVYDSILLENDVLGGLPTPSVLPVDSFYSAADATAAHTWKDRVIYNTTTGALYFDADGNGTASAPVKFAVMGSAGARPELTYADFVVV